VPTELIKLGMTAETCLHRSHNQIILFCKSVTETHLKKLYRLQVLPVTSNLNYQYFHNVSFSFNPSTMKDSSLVGIYTVSNGK